jgi:hypothetical protein
MTMDTTASTTARAINNTVRIVSLETVGDASVFRCVVLLGCVCSVHCPRRNLKQRERGTMVSGSGCPQCTPIGSLNATRSSLLPTRKYKSLESHTGTVNALVALHPDGWVASASADKCVAKQRRVGVWGGGGWEEAVRWCSMQALWGAPRRRARTGGAVLGHEDTRHR